MEAKKLPSGSWRCQIFSHYEEVPQKDGSIKRKRVYKSFTCSDPSKKGKRKCEQMAAEWAADKEVRTKETMTVSEVVEQYISLKEPVLSPSTIKAYKSLQNNCFTNLGPVSIGSLTPERLQRWVGEISYGRSAKTVKNAHALLVSSVAMFMPGFKSAAKLPQREQPDLYIPTDADVQILLQHVAGKELEIAIYLAAFGPMRRGEICALTDQDIHGNIISVNKSMVLTSDNTWVLKAPKTYASYRDIMYPDFVIDRIKDIKGNILKCNPSQLTNRFRRAIEYTDVPAFRFHDLRHYSASILHAMGIPDVYIMQRGGWTTDNVMKTVYRHTLSDKNIEMNNKANNYFSELCNTKCNTKTKNP